VLTRFYGGTCGPRRPSPWCEAQLIPPVPERN